MRSLITAFILFVFTTTAFCQNLNEQLYKAIHNKDSITVKNLLDKKANPDFKKKVGFFEMSMLILAVQNNDISDVKLLVSHGAKVDWRDAFSSTALMYAAALGNKDIILYLINNGADVNAKDKQGNSVLSAAKESKNSEAIEIVTSFINKKSQ